MLSLAWLGAECDRWGMPLLAETIPGGWGGGAEMRTSEAVAAGARVGAAAGADFIKTFMVDEPGEFEKVVAETPAIYVTFENSPANLLQKAIAARATPALRVSDIRRGYADPAALEEAAQRLPLEQLYLVEGNGALSVADVRAKARRATARHSASQCLVVVDYLQLWAKASRELRELGTIRERVEALGTELGELSRRLDSPVLAIVSQSRAANYGREGTGRAALDTLKESGDLEYAADVVMFLTSSDRFAQPPMQALDLTIKKNRHGPGDKVVPLVFRADHGVMHLEAPEAA